MPQTQSFQQHARYVPQFHFVLGPILIVNFVWRVVQLVRVPSWETTLAVLMGVAFILMFLSMRGFTVKVQDRVIRLEEEDRLRRLMPADFHGRIGEFTPNQLIGLRFASDAELPTLARQVLGDKIHDRKAIKGLIKNWRSDDMRA